MAILIILGIVVFALAVLPQMWVQRVLAQHRHDRADIPGTGGEFARHVLDGMKLDHVGVEESKIGDHYDPAAKVVRLSPEHLRGRLLAAMVVAAHEVGHAMQDATGYRPLAARTRLAKQANTIQRVGSVVMLTAPIMLAIAKAPGLVLVQVVAGAAILGSTVLMHLLTLPVEMDASFRRALPLLKEGRYLDDNDMPAARSILRAAAFTYVAAAAYTLLDVAQWARIILRR
jgi:Zn-dependent membrane protease YugP